MKRVLSVFVPVIIAAATVVLVAAAAVAIHASRQADPVFEANVEALTRQEATPGTGLCYRSIYTKESSSVLYCGACMYIPNSAAFPLSGTGMC